MIYNKMENKGNYTCPEHVHMDIREIPNVLQKASPDLHKRIFLCLFQS